MPWLPTQSLVFRSTGEYGSMPRTESDYSPLLAHGTELNRAIRHAAAGRILRPSGTHAGHPAVNPAPPSPLDAAFSSSLVLLAERDRLQNNERVAVSAAQHLLGQGSVAARLRLRATGCHWSHWAPCDFAIRPCGLWPAELAFGPGVLTCTQVQVLFLWQKYAEPQCGKTFEQRSQPDPRRGGIRVFCSTSPPP